MDNFNDKYKTKNPFAVPDGYFDGLTDRIMDQVKEEKKPHKVRGMRIFKPYMGWVAVFVVTLMVVQVLYPLATGRNQNVPGGAAEQTILSADGIEEDIFDSHFNPTSEEIIEYLAAEVDSYELMYAGIY